MQRFMVGSDRIAANGYFANKIGTYASAVAARYHRIPFYVVAPDSTVGPDCPNGEATPTEQRDAQEIRGVSGACDYCRCVPERSEVANPAFDITPAGLATSWVLDRVVPARRFGPQSWWQTKREQP